VAGEKQDSKETNLSENAGENKATYNSMDWFKGKFTGKPYISRENLWFPVDFPNKTNPLNNSRSAVSH
jgi:hypothetical protein